MNKKIFSTGIIDSTFGSDCVVADNVNIYGATLGKDCFVGPWVEIQGKTRIGNNVRIQSHSFICEEMIIGNNVFVGHGVMTCNSRRPISGEKEWKCEAPIIGDNVSVGSNATILPGVVIADNCVIGAGATVTKNTMQGSTIIGVDKVLHMNSQNI